MSYDIDILGNRSSAELIATLPITKGTPYTVKNLFSEAVSDIKAGEKFLVHSDGQVDSDYTYNVMLGSKLVITDAAGVVLAEIAEAHAQNFNQTEHHYNWTRVGSYVAVNDIPGVSYVRHQIWAAASQSVSGNKLTVSQDYGRLVVWRFTPALVAA